MSKRQGWTISEVEALVGLSRRDIQRCCYEGKGGVGILSPKDSKWGRRTYTEADLARLFLVAQMKSRGLSLPEVKRELDQAAAEGRTDADLLKDLAYRLAEQLEQTESLLLSARAILHRGNRQMLEEIITDHLRRTSLDQVDLQCQFGDLDILSLDVITNDSRLFMLKQLDLPGLALALELCSGPQTAERLREKLDSLGQPNDTKED